MKSSQRVIQARHNEILRILQKHGHMQVTVLSQLLNVSPPTMRRDLNHLEAAGMVTRQFGEAQYRVPGDMKQIEPTNVEDEKALVRRKIAKKASEMIEDGDVVFMNSSSTASLVLEYLSGKHVTILTNNARIINREYPPNLQILFTGGELYGRKQSLVGHFAQDTIARVSANKCVLGVSGVSVEGGLTSVILAETQINMQMLQQCRGPRIVVADGSKVGRIQFFYSGDIRNITTMITDSSADSQAIQQLENCGIQVIIV